MYKLFDKQGETSNTLIFANNVREIKTDIRIKTKIDQDQKNINFLKEKLVELTNRNTELKKEVDGSKKRSELEIEERKSTIEIKISKEHQLILSNIINDIKYKNNSSIEIVSSFIPSRL